jgi:penicillin-binding protein 2
VVKASVVNQAMFRIRILVLAVLATVCCQLAVARTATSTVKAAKKNSTDATATTAPKRTAKVRHARSATATRAALRKRRRAARRVERFRTSSFATGVGADDDADGEDPIVRQAAVDALGNMNGTVVVINPENGRILAMVNQKLALSSGAQPCSTIKIAVALAGLSEGVITRESEVKISRYSEMNLTDALAHSNNAYFEAVGRRLGFPKVRRYARQFGLGELAGYEIEGEHLGTYPAREIDARRGGVGKMCSFGEGISMTPLQLGALVSAVANGGTLYYLQHPESPEEVAEFKPKVKRVLNISEQIPEIIDGMTGAVQYGTARSLRLNFTEEPILGKTGTCSKAGTRFGWFASYADTDHGRVVAVVFLRGGRPTYGPKAAEITGKIYRSLYDHDFFTKPATASTKPEQSSSGTAR